MFQNFSFNVEKRSAIFAQLPEFLINKLEIKIKKLGKPKEGLTKKFNTRKVDFQYLVHKIYFC